MERHSDNVSAQKPGRSHGSLLLWLPAVLLLYILSLGPADRLVGAASPAAKAFYAPVFWVYLRVPPFRQALDMYMRLWDKNW
jgi:hypothetical protein